MGKPERIYFVATQNAPLWGYGHAGKRIYSREGMALNLAKRVRSAGGTATVFVADLDWRPLDG